MAHLLILHESRYTDDSMLSVTAAMRAAAAALVVLLAGCGGANGTVPQSERPPAALRANRSGTRTGVIVPLYVYPGKTWNAVIQAKNAHPGVPIAIIANVNNGPGTNVDSTYVAFIEKAQMAGIDVLGYVYTQNGKRSATAVDADMAAWEAFYKPDGIFLDQMAPDDPSYYQAATAYAHGHSLWFVMGNPGVDAPGDSGPDVINFYEQAGYPRPAFLGAARHQQYGKSRWSYMAGAVPLESKRITQSTKYVGYLYATDGREPECYCRLPSYFDKLVALLDT